MTTQQKYTLHEMGRKTVPMVGYIVAIAMILCAVAMAFGSAFFVLLFDEVIIGGFGFLGAVLMGGQGVIALQHQLEKSFCSQPVKFVQT